MGIYNVLSRLLDYPDEELKQNMVMLRSWVSVAESVRDKERVELWKLLQWMDDQN